MTAPAEPLKLKDLDGALASLQQLKPPGASKGKIQAITQLCSSNIRAEASIVQSLYLAFKGCPPTHKLGTLFVIDSVVRQWVTKAASTEGHGNTGADIVDNFAGRGEPGSYSAAIKRVMELMPALMEDILKGIPDDQKPKLNNLVIIWEKGKTFPTRVVEELKAKTAGYSGATAAPKMPTPPKGKQPAIAQHAHTNGTQAHAESKSNGPFKAPMPTRMTTPPGYPPQHLFEQGMIPSKKSSQTNGSAAAHSRPVMQQARPVAPPAAPQPAAQPAPTQDVNAILAALASAVPKPTPAPAPMQQAPSSAPPAQQPNGQDLAALLAGASGAQRFQPPPMPQQLPPTPSYPQYAPAPQPAYQPPPSVAQYQQPAYAPPPVVQPQPPSDPLAGLAKILPPSVLTDPQKLQQAIGLLSDLAKQGIPQDQWGPVIQALHPEPAYPQQASYQGGGYDPYRGRERSRSPQRGGAARKRASPVYGSFEEVARMKREEEERKEREAFRNRRNYRDRSPMQSQSAAPAINGNGTAKYIGFDNHVPDGHIKVLSRTLFVGGANGTQAEIQNLFSRFGEVQTCIVNLERRHAFVKMTTRQFSLAAKEGMERLQRENDREVMSVARQTKWGVGFGPRECCDYASGTSVIPISKLTDADHKWLLTAAFGGTGGRPLESGMVLEEPDIEIGAGVSSKAMSKRVQADSGPPSGKRNDGGRGKRNRDNGRFDGMGGGRYESPRPEAVQVATPPAVPGFGFGFALPGQNGMGAYR